MTRARKPYQRTTADRPCKRGCGRLTRGESGLCERCSRRGRCPVCGQHNANGRAVVCFACRITLDWIHEAHAGGDLREASPGRIRELAARAGRGLPLFGR